MPSTPDGAPPQPQTWLILGASRGIGLTFVRHLLNSPSSSPSSPSTPSPSPSSSSPIVPRILATARSPASANELYALTGHPNGKNLTILECDVTDEESIERMVVGGVGRLRERVDWLGRIDVVVCNAGVLRYPNGVLDVTFQDFELHLKTNTIGPLITAQRLLKLSPSLPIGTIVFISSDSGSTTNFREFEDGFAAYAASKAALNQGLRHLAAELHRKKSDTVVLALHPGEVATDMQNITTEWEVEGIITPEESVTKMLKVIEEKGQGGKDEGGGEKGVASFWTWEGNRYPW